MSDLEFDNWDNLYSSPEKWDLRIVGSIDHPDACYSFDYLVVWQHEDGRLFYGRDSGCSCPAPFEYVKSLDQVTEIEGADGFRDFCVAVDEHCEYASEYIGEERSSAFLADKVELKAKISGLLRR